MQTLNPAAWFESGVLSSALTRMGILGQWNGAWQGAPASFLEWTAGQAGMDSDALFERLIHDREAELELGFAAVALDPALFPNRGTLPHPGPLGSFFLPLWEKDGVLACVTHTPLLLPSRRALQTLASLYSVSAVSVLYCKPWSFDAYAAALLKRHADFAETRPDPDFPPAALHLSQPWLDLEGFQIPAELCELVPSRFQRRFDVAPVHSIGGSCLTVAVEKVPDLVTRSEFAELLPSGYSVRYALAEAEHIHHAISAASASDVDMGRLTSRLRQQGAAGSTERQVERIDFQTISRRSLESDNAPAVTLLQTLLLHAVRHNASDLHIARGEKHLSVEYRLDDWKSPYPDPIPASFAEPILARIKVLAELDLQRQPVPQFGKFVIDVTQVGEVEVRVTIMPTVQGDAATLRFARRKERFPRLAELGMRPHEAGILQRIVDGSYGLGLVVGPTGSGKSTTLYSLLSTIPADKYEVLSAEDPVERFLPGIKQTNIHKGLTYAAYLAGALRADPDYIHIGETRTPETAEQVLKAAETGHIVFTTVHTHQACAAPARLFGLGLESYMLADALAGVVAQHLLPKICPHCQDEAKMPGEESLRALGIDPEWFGSAPQLREGQGCGHCRNRGAIGRMLVAEGYYADALIHDLVLRRRPLTEIREAQKAQGGKTLLLQAIEAAAAGKVPLSAALSLGSSSLA